MKISFASDNYASAHPDIIAAVIAANQGHEPSYGKDPITLQAEKAIQTALNQEAPLWFVGTGTAANTLAIKSVLRSYQSVICLDSAHIVTHETGAPHHIVGCKFLTCPGTAGKITPDEIQTLYENESVWGIHATQPRLVSISQTTEVGTVYTPEELQAIRTVCDQLDLILHIDGCRIYQAAASLDCTLAELASFADVLSLGGTKAGLMFGEAVVFMNADLATGFEYLQKQGLQLFSKMRFLSAQFLALFTDELGLEMARHCRRMTQKLAEGFGTFAQCRLVYPAESNMLFLELPESCVAELQEHSHFYMMPGENIARLVVAQDVDEQHIDSFLAHAGQILR